MTTLHEDAYHEIGNYITHNDNLTIYMEYMLKYGKIEPPMQWLDLKTIARNSKFDFLYKNYFELLLFVGKLSDKIFTPYYMNSVIEKGDLEFIKRIYAIKKDIFDEEHMRIASAYEDCYELVKWLHEIANQKPTMKALVVAAGCNNIDIARYLNQHISEEEYRRALGYGQHSDPLEVALWHRNYDIAKLLVESGRPVSTKASKLAKDDNVSEILTPSTFR